MNTLISSQINGLQQNLFLIMSFGTLIMSEKESWLLICGIPKMNTELLIGYKYKVCIF